MGDFVDSLLPTELQDCRKILIVGLGDNPREVKRFINTLVLHYQLAKIKKIRLDTRILLILLLFQHITPDLYQKFILDHSLLAKLKDSTEDTKEICDKYLDTHERLRNAFELVDSVPKGEDFEVYLYLTKTVGINIEAEQLRKHYGFWNRRDNPRKKVNIPIKIIFNIDPPFELSGLTMDLCMHGSWALFNSAMPRNIIDNRIPVTIELLYKKKKIQIQKAIIGRHVYYSEGETIKKVQYSHGIAIRFQKISKTMKKRLEEILS